MKKRVKEKLQSSSHLLWAILEWDKQQLWSFLFLHEGCLVNLCGEVINFETIEVRWERSYQWRNLH